MKPISDDLRKRVIDRRLAGDSAADISSLFGVSVRSIQRYYQRYLERDSLSADKKGRPNGSILDNYRKQLTHCMETNPSITLEELCEHCQEHFSVSVHHTTMLRVLRRWGYRYKKNADSSRAQPS